MTFFLTAEEAIIWVIRFLSIYIVIDSAEKLAVFQEFKKNGLFHWSTMRQNGFFKKRSVLFLKLADFIFNSHCWIILIAARCCAGLTLFLATNDDLLTKLMLLVVFFTGSLMNLRNTPFGAETENRFALIITGALLLRYFAPTPMVTLACLWFIALQSCVSYFTAGVTKMFNAEWRNGNGIRHVFESPGLVATRKATYWLKEHPSFAKFLTWGTLSMECAFPVALAGWPLVWLFLAWGILFHVGIAIFIRLGKFFWVWIATYPAIIFVAH
jgi:hypothetical protein